MSNIPPRYQYCAGSAGWTNKVRVVNWRDGDRKRSKPSLILDDMKLSMRDANDSTRKLLEMINSAIKDAESMYTNQHLFNTPTTGTIGRACGHATIHRSLQENKLRIRLTKEVKYLSENTLCAYGLLGCRVWQWPFYQKLFTDSVWSQSQSPSHSSQKLKRKSYPKIHMEPQNILGSQNNPDQKEKCWRYYHSIFRNITEP